MCLRLVLLHFPRLEADGVRVTVRVLGRGGWEVEVELAVETEEEEEEEGEEEEVVVVVIVEWTQIYSLFRTTRNHCKPLLFPLTLYLLFARTRCEEEEEEVVVVLEGSFSNRLRHH